MAKMRNNLIKRGNTWSYAIRVADPATGESKQHMRGGYATQAEAAAARDAARVADAQGTFVLPTTQTLADYLAEWLDSLNLKPKTIQGYRYNVERYIVPRIGGTRLRDLRAARLSKFYKDLAVNGGRNGDPLGHSSIESVHRTLRAALSAAVKADLLGSNPASKAVLPPKPSQSIVRRRALEICELRLLLDAAAEHRLGPLVHLAAATGMRRGELLFLRWRHLDLENRRVTIEGSRSDVAGRSTEGTPKSGKSRTLTFDEETAAVMARHRERQARERVTADEVWHQADDYVFRTEDGRPLRPDSASKIVGNLCEMAGIRKATLHDMRHTHATLMLTDGVPVHEVSARLGHRDPTVTMTTYAHVLRQREDGHGDRFGSILAASG